MITKIELQTLLSDVESDRMERTQSTNDTDKFCEAICAFANDFPNNREPGYLIIGAKDSGEIAGIEINDQLLKNLGGIRSDGNIQPLPTLVIKKISLNGGDVAVVEVQPSDMPPVRYKGRVWIRVGPRKAAANEQEERMLTERRVTNITSSDAYPYKEAKLSDLSLSLFAAYRQNVVASDIIAANHRSPEEQLASLRFFDLRLNCPTLAGLLLFGTNPRFFLPGAYVQYLKLPGASLTDRPIDQAEVSGDLLNMLRELDNRIKANISTTLKSTSVLKESAISDYPEIAIREILLNAVMHRDYLSNTPVRLSWFADKIEIQSPGGLYGEVTQETLTTSSSYRNPVVAEALKTLGYVNRFGYGIQRAQAALKENGSPPVEHTINDRTVLATIHQRPQ
jgi:ATP-dependent DNA helicase RecG